VLEFGNSGAECAFSRFWISPRCPALPAGCAEGAGESLTKFKASLLNYLCQYTNPDIITWIEIVRKVDFSTVRVFLVETIPGTHSAQNNKTHCTRIEQLILEHRNAPLYQPWHFPGARKHGIIVAQLNSIEVFPDDPPKWFYNDVWTPLYGGEARRNEPVLHIIYPTVDNVRFGAYRRSGARCLSCSRDFLDENPWLRPYLRQVPPADCYVCNKQRVSGGGKPKRGCELRSCPARRSIATRHRISPN
jgi:tyrosyl-DNA phosphodiesterase-1